MKKIILVLLAINFSATAYNQSITGTILDKETNKPVFSSAVFFNGTSVGTLSDKDGNFSLKNLDHSSIPLSVSAIGYYSVSLPSYSTSKPNIIYLRPRLFELNEVIVNDKSHARERRTNLRTFRNVFLGSTGNASACEITNEDDIRFKYSTDNDTLKAFALKPLIIDNQALGYKITYYLEDFKFSKPDSIFLFNGDIIFTDYSASQEKKTLYFDRKRKQAYMGSRMHFFRTLWFNELDSAGFRVINSANDTLTYKDLVTQKDNHTKFLKYKRGILGICYHSEQPETLLTLLRDSVLFDPNGYFEPHRLSWQGQMAQQRIADQLPYDYLTEK
jgi:CarboxypepD_reg-like domain